MKKPTRKQKDPAEEKLVSPYNPQVWPEESQAYFALNSITLVSSLLLRGGDLDAEEANAAGDVLFWAKEYFDSIDLVGLVSKRPKGSQYFTGGEASPEKEVRA